MATYVIAPGAWLSGSGLNPPISGQSPLHPPIVGSSPLHPPIVGSSPLHPPIVGNGPLHPPINTGVSQLAADAVLAAGVPWRSTDPAWVYQGGARALLAQALERTHSNIVRPTDPRRRPTTPGVMRAPAHAPDADAPLWRWGSEFRVQAVLADLVWRLRVEKRLLKYTRTDQASLSFDFALPTETWWLDQIDKVQRAAIEREDRLPEILAQSDDLWSFFRVVLGIDAGTSAILEEVLTVAWKWATPLVMALKNEVAALRPVQWAPRVLPAIATPAHGSLPSGHATMAALTAEILSQLMFGGDQTHPRVQQLDRLVRRIAFNRVVAGVHFPVDSSAGYALGLQLAGHFVGWATGQAPYKTFNFEPVTDFELVEGEIRPELKRQARKDGRSKPLGLLWDAAMREAHRSKQ
jgi:hypothetical protein